MASTTMNRGMRPPDGFAFIAGLVIIVFRIALVLGFAWMACLIGILGFETVRLGDTLQVHITTLPAHYYTAALYIALCLIGVLHMIRQAVTVGLFGFNTYVVDEPEKKEEENK